ncbi:fatty acid synthase alpha subunit Lsd1 [Marasmius sp. AFHP31]|nr:fatty acid synthase alpha subunit Lsd1 [Marasmius sp. AFHP31]
MRTRRVYTGEDLKPGSELWPYLWSRSHGPVPHLEPVAHGHVLDKFRNKFKASKRPIYSVLKSEAQYFNGLGAQESCDLLVRNVIHPLLPTSCLCADDLLWARFKKAIHDHFTFTYDLIHKTNNPPFPHVSSSAAFKMNIHAHSRYITAAVFCYRRASVLVDQQWLDKAHAQNLFDNQGILKRDGTASESKPSQSRRVPVIIKKSKRTHIPNYCFDCDGTRCYAPFTCRSDLITTKPKKSKSKSKSKSVNPEDDDWISEDDWASDDSEALNSSLRTPKLVRVKPEQDVKDEYNSTTLGPYSFQAFVCNSWSKSHLEKTQSDVLPRRLTIASGRRATIQQGMTSSQASSPM